MNRVREAWVWMPSCKDSRLQETVLKQAISTRLRMPTIQALSRPGEVPRTDNSAHGQSEPRTWRALLPHRA